MKTGKTLVELAQELERRANNKQDVLAKAPAVEMSVEEDANGEFDKLLKLNVKSEKFSGSYKINEYCHNQIGEYCGIPAGYYDRCRNEDPELLVHNVNTWVQRHNDVRLVRTLDGTARAWLSNSYRPLENEDLASAILPILLDSGDYDLMSMDVTDRRLYIKVVGRAFSRELAKHGASIGDGGHTIVNVVFPAITISNSEVGAGALSIQRGMFNGGCSNLAVFGEKSMRKTHLGVRNDLMPADLLAVMSDDTRRHTDAALWGQVKDVVKAGFDEKHFDALVAQCNDAGKQEFSKDCDIARAIKIAGQKLGINEGEQKGVLQALIKGGDLTRLGLHNAVTRFSQDVDSYDRASELERVGAQVIELPQRDWNLIASAN
jgi:hypothetical protein